MSEIIFRQIPKLNLRTDPQTQINLYLYIIYNISERIICICSMCMYIICIYNHTCVIQCTCYIRCKFCIPFSPRENVHCDSVRAKGKCYCDSEICIIIRVLYNVLVSIIYPRCFDKYIYILVCAVLYMDWIFYFWLFVLGFFYFFLYSVGWLIFFRGEIDNF